MKYSVEITPTAEADLESAFHYIRRRSPLNAQRWLKAIYKAIDTLEMFPTRCGLAREAMYLDADLRQYIFKSHRIIFVVDLPAKKVRILHIRHASMRPLGEPENGA